MIATARSPSRTGSTGLTLRLAIGFAWLTAAGYLLLALGALGTGGLQPEPGAEVIPYTAAGCYALGGLLLLVRRRWLWIVGAVFNALVMLMFFSAYSGDASVLLSSGGLATKSMQLLLQAALLALILRGR